MHPTASPRLRRGSAAALVLGLFVALGIVVVFAGTLARATELEAEAAAARADVAALAAQVEAGRDEIAFTDSDRFVEQQARALGYGLRGERAFRLPDDAPLPPPVALLGATVGEVAPLTPFEGWMELLFGG